jgi:hypothetical protein
LGGGEFRRRKKRTTGREGREGLAKDAKKLNNNSYRNTRDSAMRHGRQQNTSWNAFASFA